MARILELLIYLTEATLTGIYNLPLILIGNTFLSLIGTYLLPFISNTKLLFLLTGLNTLVNAFGMTEAGM